MKSFLSNEAIELTKTPDWQLWAPIGFGNNESFWVTIRDESGWVKMGLCLYQWVSLYHPEIKKDFGIYFLPWAVHFILLNHFGKEFQIYDMMDVFSK